MQDVKRLEAGHDTGNPVRLDEWLVSLGANDCRNVCRAEIAIHLEIRVAGERCHRTGHGFMGAEHEEVVEIFSFSGQYAAGDGWCGGFKTDTEEDHVRVRAFLREKNRVKGRIDNFD